jgi:putative endonuclease
MGKQPAVYILTNKKRGTLYVGVTSDLVRRIWQHRNDQMDGFTNRYGLHRLVHYELTEDMYTAISREKQLKWWRRQWKVDLIEVDNPDWNDLWPGILP